MQQEQMRIYAAKDPLCGGPCQWMENHQEKTKAWRILGGGRSRTSASEVGGEKLGQISSRESICTDLAEFVLKLG